MHVTSTAHVTAAHTSSAAVAAKHRKPVHIILPPLIMRLPAERERLIRADRLLNISERRRP